MARVVQQRSTGAPYLLITMVFLFLMASAMAGIFYNSNSKLKKTNDEWKAKSNEVADAGDRSGDTFKQMLAQARDQKTTVVALLDKRNRELVATIASDETSAGAAAKTARDKRDSYTKAKRDRDEALIKKWQDSESERASGKPATSYDVRGKKILAKRQATGDTPPPDADQSTQDTLLAVIKELDTELADANEEVGRMEKLYIGEKASVATLKGEMATAQKKYAADIAAETAKVTAKQLEFDQCKTEYKDSIDAIKRTKDEEIKAKDDDLNKLDKDIAGLRNEIRIKDNEIATLEAKIRKGEDSPGAEGPDSIIAADAKVLRAESDEGVVYINIGATDRVRRGLRFTVFDDREGVDLSGDGKAKIVVTSVRESTAECRITQSERGNPIIGGDLVSNLAFDAAIPPLFVLEGPFDLDGDGQVEARGEERIKTMITRYGGRLAEEVAPNVDYVVMGQRPSLPATKPPEGATPVELAIYQQKEKLFRHYGTVRSAATSMRKPVLSARQLLTLIGYVPGQGD